MFFGVILYFFGVETARFGRCEIRENRDEKYFEDHFDKVIEASKENGVETSLLKYNVSLDCHGNNSIALL